jgi:hypothetical protein
MSGNVDEWTQHCVDNDCFYGGGYFGSPSVSASCPTEISMSPDDPNVAIGFRCCQDLPMATSAVGELDRPRNRRVPAGQGAGIRV